MHMFSRISIGRVPVHLRYFLIKCVTYTKDRMRSSIVPAGVGQEEGGEEEGEGYPHPVCDGEVGRLA